MEMMNALASLQLKNFTNAPKAVPTVFALMVKTDKNNCPVRAKSRIVVLGNLKDREWTHPECYAPA